MQVYETCDLGSNPGGGTTSINTGTNKIERGVCVRPLQGLALIMERYPEVKAIVNSDRSPQQAADDINQYGLMMNRDEIKTTERSVRRARKSSVEVLTDPHVGSKIDTSNGAWAPGVEFEEDRENNTLAGVARIQREDPSRPLEDEEIYRQFGLDPSVWKIDKIRRSQWDSPSGDLRESVKAEFSRRIEESDEETTTIDFEDLERYLAAYPDFERPKADPNGRVLLFAIGDTQAGKPDGGGSQALIQRYASVVAQFKARLKETEGAVVVAPWLGDCIEGLVSQGGRNIARLDLTVTEQVRLVRRLMIHMIGELAPLASTLLIPVVGGNHDEAYRLQDQGVNDSWAIEAGSAVADAIDMAPEKFGHVKFVFPKENELGITLTIGQGNPYTIHFEHGHMARSPEKIIDWWKGQAMGNNSAGDAQMLMTAHWHHLRLQQTYGRVWVQVPALEGGSDWYKQRTGDHSPAGAISFEVIGGPIGFTGLEIHTA